MTTKFTTIVHMNNGEILTFKGEEAMTFEMQDRGLLFVHSNIKKESDAKTLIRYRYTRNWIPYVNIRNIEVYTTKEITNAEEFRKYNRFLEKGIDMIMTPISNTVPKSAAEAAKEIEAEDKKP